jgi:hypothetical protein
LPFVGRVLRPLLFVNLAQTQPMHTATIPEVPYETTRTLGTRVPPVASLVGQEYAVVRTKLLAIPSEQAPRVHRCRTVAEVQDTLREIITRILEELTADAAVP